LLDFSIWASLPLAVPMLDLMMGSPTLLISSFSFFTAATKLGGDALASAFAAAMTGFAHARQSKPALPNDIASAVVSASCFVYAAQSSASFLAVAQRCAPRPAPCWHCRSPSPRPGCRRWRAWPWRRQCRRRSLPSAGARRVVDELLHARTADV
jgi:hypothetical protein